jgi:hypothetical protein
MSYEGVTDTLSAKTRSGSRLELKDVNGLIPLLAFRDVITDERLLQSLRDVENYVNNDSERV